MTEMQAFAFGFYHAMELMPRDTVLSESTAYSEGYDFGQREFAKEYAAHAAHEHEDEERIPF